MKRMFSAILLFGLFLANAQFTVEVEVPAQFTAKEAILYTLNGSKDIISSKETRKGNKWSFAVTKRYLGLMKIYFPEVNNSLTLISENKNASIKLSTDVDKVKEVVYLDQPNKLMEELQDQQKKNELIYPALVQIQEYYKDSSEFGRALRKEIDVLGKKVVVNPQNNPFVAYYDTNYNKFLVNQSAKTAPTQDEVIKFISDSGDMLESSSLLRPMLVSLLTTAGNANAESVVDRLLNKVEMETPRGQVVLSELIELFDMYNMQDLKTKYLTKAKNLKCTIFDRLNSTLQANKNVEMGATMPNYTFTNPSKTSAKSIYDVKADKKVVIFWSSTCSHCEAELPVLLEQYKALKSKNIEIIGLSLDTDKSTYQNKINALPWINDTELKGWNSTFAETYNVHATPTYLILDANNRIVAKPDRAHDVLLFFNQK